MNEHDVLLESLLWNMAHDPSAANRIAALESIPVYPNTHTGLPLLIVYEMKKSRFVSKRSRFWETRQMDSLSLEQYAQIVRSSLGNRYVFEYTISTDMYINISSCILPLTLTTYVLYCRCTATSQAATRMICASWMKHVRFDPIALIGLLDPVLHEQECHKVCRVLFQVAQEESPTALEELSPAEIRAFQQGVSRVQYHSCQMHIPPTTLSGTTSRTLLQDQVRLSCIFHIDSFSSTTGTCHFQNCTRCVQSCVSGWNSTFRVWWNPFNKTRRRRG